VSWLKQRERIEDKFCENITFFIIIPPGVVDFGILPPGYKSIMVISGGMILFLNADHFFWEKRKPPIEGGNSVLKILEKNREN